MWAILLVLALCLIYVFTFASFMERFDGSIFAFWTIGVIVGVFVFGYIGIELQDPYRPQRLQCNEQKLIWTEDVTQVASGSTVPGCLDENGFQYYMHDGVFVKGTVIE